MDYAVFDAARAGVRRVVVILRESALGQLSSLQARYGGRMEVVGAVQRLDDLPSGMLPPDGRVRPWGSAQALLAARDAAGEAFLVVNGDDFYGRESYQRLIAARASDPAGRWHLAGFQLGDTLSPQGTVNRAVCAMGQDGELIGLEEVSRIARQENGRLVGEVHGHKRLLAPNDVVSMNMWSLTGAVFPLLQEGFRAFLGRADLERDEYYLPEGIAGGIAAGHAVQVLPASARWCGVTYREDADDVRRHLAELTERGEYPSPLWP